MSHSVHSDDTEIFYSSTLQATTYENFLRTLEHRCRKKYVSVGDSVKEINLQDVQPEILLVKNLQEVRFERGVVDQFGVNAENLLSLLSEEKENIKKEIESLKRAIDEENEAINKVQNLVNRLKNMKVIRSNLSRVESATLKLNKKFQSFKAALNTLIEELYPVKEDEIKVILLDLVSSNPRNSDTYPYVKITKTYDFKCIENLVSSNIIELHPELNGYIKLCCELM